MNAFVLWSPIIIYSIFLFRSAHKRKVQAIHVEHKKSSWKRKRNKTNSRLQAEARLIGCYSGTYGMKTRNYDNCNLFRINMLQVKSEMLHVDIHRACNPILVIVIDLHFKQLNSFYNRPSNDNDVTFLIFCFGIDGLLTWSSTWDFLCTFEQWRVGSHATGTQHATWYDDLVNFQGRKTPETLSVKTPEKKEA